MKHLLLILATLTLATSCHIDCGPCGCNYREVYDRRDGRLVDCIPNDLYYETETTDAQD